MQWATVCLCVKILKRIHKCLITLLAYRDRGQRWREAGFSLLTSGYLGRLTHVNIVPSQKQKFKSTPE